MTDWKMGKWIGKPRMWLSFPYSSYTVSRVKEIYGARYEFNDKLWSFPLDLEVARDIYALAKKLGATLTVEDDLKQWARDEKNRYANVLKPDDLDADVSKYLPYLRANRPDLIKAMESKPWQIPGAAFIVGQKQVLLADKPGLGKTIQTLAAIAELDIRGPILVVAPRTAVQVTWPEEIRQWLGAEVIVRINSSMRPAERKKRLERVKNAPPNCRTWVLVGPNYLRIRPDFDDYGNYLRDDKGKKIIRTVKEGLPELFDIEWHAVIVDESHQTLAGATGNKKKQSAQRLGLGALKIAPGAPQIAISGTPFRGKTENIWGTLNWLDPHKYSSYWTWVKRHYGVQTTTSQFGSGVLKGDRIRNEKKFFKELEPIMVRRTKEEVQKDLPPKTYGGHHLDPNDPNSPVAVWLPMSPRQQAQYNSVVKDAVIRLSGAEINVNGVLAEMTRFKQLANACLAHDAVPSLPSNKIEWILDFLDERQEAGTKVIVASQFTGFLELLSKQLTAMKIGHYLFTGKTSDVERSRVREQFQKEGGDLVVLLNTKSGGVSLTLDMADDVVVCDQTWIPDDQEQVEDRAHRVSRNHNVTVWNLASLGTIDEAVAVTNSAREDAIFSILDGQRGVAYVKAILSKMKGAA
jgi:SNF2 family DNA or RNA helicase